MINWPNCFTFVVAVSAIAYAAPMRAATTQPLDLICAPLPDRNPTPRDPIISIRVTENDGVWNVVLASANGNKYYRAKQYNIRDISAPDLPSWSGILSTNSAIRMVGSVYWKTEPFDMSNHYLTRTEEATELHNIARFALSGRQPDRWP